MTLTSYRTLGRSGLVVSPFALGAMTFGAGRWGVEEADARAIVQAYLDAGGNLIDTSDVYGGGKSEEMLGKFIAETRERDRIVLATKFTWNTGYDAPRDSRMGNPNAGGNGRKNILRALEASLKRLQTDYVDLYWLHFWDMVTPVDEVLETLVDLIRAGKIRYYGLSDVPAWYMTRMATLAAERGVPGPIALQTQYSLIERSAEFEHVPAAGELGISLQAWSPLAGGFLSGKYRRDGARGDVAGRLSGDNPLGQTAFTDRNWDILDAVRGVAEASNRSPADIALLWAASQPGVGSVLIGGTSSEQISRNAASLNTQLSADDITTLEKASRPSIGFPWAAFTGGVRKSIFGGADVTKWDALQQG